VALPELKGKRLGCWCAPLPCHGDILRELCELYRDHTGCAVEDKKGEKDDIE